MEINIFICHDSYLKVSIHYKSFHISRRYILGSNTTVYVIKFQYITVLSLCMQLTESTKFSFSGFYVLVLNPA